MIISEYTFKVNFLYIVTWIESGIIGTYMTSSYLYAMYSGFIDFRGYKFSWIKENVYVHGYFI